MKRNKKGFTLIEILVVVLIIGVLSAIAVPFYRKAVEKAKAAEAVAVLNDAAKAEQDFALASSRYTSYWEDLIVNHPNVVAGTVYCIKGTNTANQDDCGNDSSYKVKLTVGDDDKSVVMATRMPNNPYADYKLFKFMNGDPNIYCKAAATSQTDICTVLGFPTKTLPETRNIDRVENFECASEIPDCSVQANACISGISGYNNCEKTIYDDGSYDKVVYDNNGNIYDVFSYDADGNMTGDTWYYENGDPDGSAHYNNGVLEWYNQNRSGYSDERSSAYVEYDSSGKPSLTLWGYLTDNPSYEDSMKAYRTYDENGKWATRGDYYDTNELSGYRQYDTTKNGWGYFAQYNKDGSIKKFTCYGSSLCGGTSGSCEGATCATSAYANYIPKSTDLPTYETYFTSDKVDKLCEFYSAGVQICQ